MPFSLYDDGAAHAASLIERGAIADTERWEPPSADAENAYIERAGWAAFGRWHLGINRDASEETKERFGFIFTSDFERVDVRGLAACAQRAGQAGYTDIRDRASALLDAANEKLGKTMPYPDRLITLVDGRRGFRASLHCDVKHAGPEPETLEFVASDETIDRTNEQIKLDGWVLENYRRNPVVVDSHDYSSVAKIIGKSVDIAVRDGALRNKIQFCTENPLGLVAWKMARAGFIRAESVGFIPLKWRYGNREAGEPSVIFERQELLEISLVPVPCNPAATVGLALKAGVLNRTDVRDLADFLRFCSEQAGARPNSGAQGAAANGARLLQLAQSIKRMLDRTRKA